MSISIKICKKLGWIRCGDRAKIKSLSYPPKECPAKWSGNANAISAFEKELCDGVFMPESLSDPIFPEKDHDLVLGLTDRYGFPVRTVLNMKSGLLRTDPYFSEADLAVFYSKHYRSIYTWQGIGLQEMRTDQINRGLRILQMLEQFKISKGSILDIGCGLGATLLPFREAGWKTRGVDYGINLVEEGMREGLNLTVGSFKDISVDFKCDIIILSHVLEHMRKPIDFLEQISSRWPTAMLFIEVPGVLNIHNAYYGNLKMYFQNAHAFHFCKESLCRILQIAGYECLFSDEKVCGIFRPTSTNRSFNEINATNILRYLENIETSKRISSRKYLFKLFGKIIKTITK